MHAGLCVRDVCVRDVVVRRLLSCVVLRSSPKGLLQIEEGGHAAKEEQG